MVDVSPTSHTTTELRMPRLPLRRLAAAVAVALLAVLATAGPASAHAQLTSTSPFDGEAVETAPEQVTLTFNEGVDAATGAIRVYDSSGERVDDATAIRPDGQTVGVGLEPGLADGSYVVTWRATSEDGHPVKGAFVFSVGDAAAVDDAVLGRLFSGDGDALAEILAGAARIATYVGVLLAAGLLLFVRIVSPRPDERDRLHGLVRRGALVAVVATVLTIPLQAMLTTGFGPLAAMRPAILAEVLGSSVGLGAVVRTVALAVLLGVGTGPLALGAGTVAALSFVIDGHTRTVDPAALMLAGDTVHVLAAAAWFGVVVALAVVLRARRLEDDPVGAATAVARASGIATVAVVLVTIAGSAMSWALVREPRALIGTAYGWTLLAKVGLAVVVIGIGLYNNRMLVPAVRRAEHPVPAGGSSDLASEDVGTGTVDGLARAGWRRLRATTRVEAGVMVGLLVVTGVLVNLRPAAEAAGITGAYETTVEVTDELDLNLVVDPNVAGANEVHVYLLDDTGRPSRELDGVRMRLELPAQDIGPIERDPLPAGPGHWVLTGSDLAIAGEWDLTVVVEIDRFTEQAVTVPVVVNAP